MEGSSYTKWLLSGVFVGGILVGSLVTLGIFYLDTQAEDQTIQTQDVMPGVPMEMQLSVNGTVGTISGGNVTLILPAGKTVPVTLSSSTEIVRRTNRDLNELAAEMENLDLAVGETPPLPFTEETLAIADISQGQQVQVESADNIIGQSTVAATRVVVFE